MKLIIGFVIVAVLAGASGNDKKLQCQIAPADVPGEWVSMTNSCIRKMKEQVQAELEAAMTYMAMGAHFYRDSVNRAGFGELFFKSAYEEREHAMKIIEYLLMRGELKQDVRELIRDPQPLKTEWPDAVSALRDALRLEASVTDKIRGIIATCEHPPKKDVPNGDRMNDYHLVDYLSGDFLDEQYKGQRELAGHISELGKMTEGHGILGEFLYDKKLLDMNTV